MNKNVKTATSLPLSIFPQKMQILSGSALKLIAIIIMFIDHSGHILLLQWQQARYPLFFIGEKGFSLYRISRDIGRMAFPIFCFLLVEGFLHTSNRFRYGRNLFLFALISEIPFNLAYQTDTIWDVHHQNVFFTLFFGYLGLCAWEYLREKPILRAICMVAFGYICILLETDYDVYGYILILILYFFRDRKWLQAILGSLWLYWEWKACFAFIFINMYNGKRGFIHGKFGKYFFYAFYPLHLTLLAILRYFIFLR